MKKYRRNFTYLTKRQQRNRILDSLLFHSFLQKDESSDDCSPSNDLSEIREQAPLDHNTFHDDLSKTEELAPLDRTTCHDDLSANEEQAPFNNLFSNNNDNMDIGENHVEEPEDHFEMETDSCCEEESLLNFLRTWAAEYNLSHAQLKPLLAKLKEHVCFMNSIPKDPRTLLGTPTGKTYVKNLLPGEYHHFGLKEGIINILKKYPDQIGDEIVLKIGIDGLPISKSSGAQFYPILDSVAPFPDVFIIGVYFGHEKPNSAEDFLDDFLEEAEDLCTNGFEFLGKLYKCKIKCIIADAPAKAFILNIKYHSGYYSCPRCTIKGKYKKHRVCFPHMGKRSKNRTDDKIRHFKYKQHQLGRCCLRRIPNFDLILGIPFDYMHLICLGCTRTLLYLYVTIRTKRRLRPWEIQKLSKRLVYLRKFSPQEFQRKPRGLKHLKYWKATEYRQFLLYTGPMVLRGILTNELLNHFNSLHVAIRILCSDFLVDNQDNLNYAKDLLFHFVEKLAWLFGEHFISYNFHTLLHLVEDVKIFGTLDNFSAFNFENFMQHLKKWMRKGDKPLQQLVRRYQEFLTNAPQEANDKKSKNLCPSSQHYRGPLLENCQSPQYERLLINGFEMNITKTADRCFGLKNGEIVMIDNIVHCANSNDLLVIARNFQIRCDLYTTPLPSSLIGEYVVKRLSDFKVFPIEDIVQKYVIVPSNKNEYIVTALLHHL